MTNRPDDLTVPADSSDDKGGGLAHPERIGPYCILQVLGEGGMGIVYDAEQIEPVKRRVALKVVKLGMDTKEVVARFDAERQALAVMDHPNIAKVYDAGATDTGRPYFVMEKVQGVPITEFCDEHRRSTRSRLALFISVCQAVQHAHQKGVIHRDLKPSNILVAFRDGKPDCKIIDFGIAKAINWRLSEKTLVTQLGQPIGTPAYMSPEQWEASRLDVDTRTDLYSLGVVLYELLVGRLPVEPAALSRLGSAAAWMLQQSAPPTPSNRLAELGDHQDVIAHLRATEADHLRRELRGDLDWIAMKAMEPDRSRRYETANGLALDVQRHLNDEPVLARPPSAMYRVRKFVRRNRFGVIAALAIVMALVAGVILATVGTIRARRAEQIAELRRNQAEDLIGFMVGDLQTQLSSIARLDLLNDVADRALQYFAAVPAEELSGGEIAARAQTLTQIGSLRMAQGELSKASEAHRQALVLVQELARRDPVNSDWQLRLAAAHFWVGYARYRYGDLDGALDQFREYLAVAERNAARDPEDLVWHVEVGYAHSNIATVLQDQGNLEGALRTFRLTMDAERRAVALEPDNTEYRLSLANSHNTVGDALSSLGRLDDALVEFRQELAIKEVLVGEDSTSTTPRKELAKSHNYVGGALKVLGHVDSALAHFQSAVALLEDLVAYDPANLGWRRSLGINLLRVGGTLRARGETALALAQVSRSLSIIAEIVDSAPDDSRYQRDLAAAHRALAASLYDAGQFEAAANSITTSIELLEGLLRVNAADRDAVLSLSVVLSLAGVHAWQNGDRQHARENFARAVDLIEPLARGSTDYGLLVALVRPLLHLDRLEQAQPILMQLDSMGYVNHRLMALRTRTGLGTGR
jgi:serine/threonine-protein kinase